jgi:hypothetical protein
MRSFIKKLICLHDYQYVLSSWMWHNDQVVDYNIIKCNKCGKLRIK